MLKDDPEDKPQSKDTISEDIAPHLNGGASTEDRLHALETIAEGPPRLPDRLIGLEDKFNWLETVVTKNKLTAGFAEDALHKHMASEEAGKVVDKSNEVVFVEILDLRARLNILATSINNITGVGIIVISTTALILAAIMLIGWKLVFG